MTRETLDSLWNSPIPVLPLDTVSLLNRFSFVEGSTVTINGAVRGPGTVAYRAGMTLRDLVIIAGGPKAVRGPAGITDTSASLLLSSVDTIAKFRLDSLLWFPAGRAFIHRRMGDGRTKVDRFAMAPIPEVFLAPEDQVLIVDIQATNRDNAVSIQGWVPSPGAQVLSKGLLVRDAIQRAGGFLPEADPGMVRLEVANDSSGAIVRQLQLDTGLTLPDAYLPLPPRSMLAIPRRLDLQDLEIVSIEGEVLRPGVYAILSKNERLSSVIRRAGGPKDVAYIEAGRLERSDFGGNGRVVIDFKKALRKPGSKADIVLRPGDRISFPRRPATLQVQGRVNNPGIVSWQDGASWKTYIAMSGGFQDSANPSGVYIVTPSGLIQTRSMGIDDPLPGSVIVVPFRKPPEPVRVTDVLSSLNVLLGTVLAGLTIYVLLESN